MKNILSRADEILLLAILRLKDNAYGVTISEEIKKRTGKDITIGSLWVSLDILTKKGLISKELTDPTEKRRGHKKIFYTITQEGLIALEDIRAFQNSIWHGAGSLIKKVKETS